MLKFGRILGAAALALSVAATPALAQRYGYGGFRGGYGYPGGFGGYGFRGGYGGFGYGGFYPGYYGYGFRPGFAYGYGPFYR